MSDRWLSSAFESRSLDDQVLALHVAEQGPVVVVEVRGDLDMDTVPALTGRTVSLLEAQPPLVMMLDLTGVQFFGAAGVRALLRIRDVAAARGTHLILRDPPPIVETILTITGVEDLFEIKTCTPGA